MEIAVVSPALCTRWMSPGGAKPLTSPTWFSLRPTRFNPALAGVGAGRPARWRTGERAFKPFGLAGAPSLAVGFRPVAGPPFAGPCTAPTPTTRRPIPATRIATRRQSALPGAGRRRSDGHHHGQFVTNRPVNRLCRGTVTQRRLLGLSNSRTARGARRRAPAAASGREAARVLGAPLGQRQPDGVHRPDHRRHVGR